MENSKPGLRPVRAPSSPATTQAELHSRAKERWLAVWMEIVCNDTGKQSQSVQRMESSANFEHHVRQVVIAKAAAIDLESQKKPEKEKNDEHIIELRSSLREKLSLLKNELGSELNDRELYLVLFPLVVHIDEKVNANLAL